MSRPSDWSPVGLDADPTPGDPVLVLAGGQEYREVARSIDNAAGAMSRLDVAGTVSKAVDALMGAKEDTISDIRKAHSRYVAAGDALVGYAGALERVQGETLAALDRARDAQDQAHSASGSRERWQELADSARDEAQKQEYESKARQAGDDADQAAGVIAGARSTIESAVSDRDRAAGAAMDRIEEITSSDDLNDGWWDDWGSKLVAAIADIADMISTIAGILAIVVAFIPVVGQALAGVLIVIAAVAAIVSAVANITLAATGERSWAEAGIAIAGAALSLIGLGGAAKAAMGLSKSIAKGTFKQGMKKGWCKLGFGACFVAGTPVLTVDGPRAIQDIRVGDKVWTRNLVTGLDELQLVAETFAHQTLALYHLSIGGQAVSTTAEHPFMTPDRGWQMAGNLRVGDVLVTSEGTTTVQAVEVEERDLADIEQVYNFHVENTHTYYVLAGDIPVLVHNNHGSAADDAVRGQVNKHIDDYVEGAVDSTAPGARMTNVRTPSTHDDYIRKLSDDGWSSRTTGRDGEITLLEKDGHKAAVREKAGSWDGWTSEYTTPGNKKADLKIRFGASE
ncbi:polymorphic toxin-type HINT domain-containing protein [Promicromonospora thailandica]|uniref:polymorphic toxin-type HINT domain-containing protein n=2 Tax=Promicromonospora thailandica TaxID=765201 RepID=UPI0020A5D676|nr:polymorphic toxin-type HINT domain-containing protein [Promicromonospora thailandica]